MSALLEVSGVSVSFDGFKAINNLSFQIGKAELRAVIGPNGIPAAHMMAKDRNTTSTTGSVVVKPSLGRPPPNQNMMTSRIALSRFARARSALQL